MDHHPDTPDSVEPSIHLDSALTGRLPCVACGYDLQGLSIRSVCPECGTAVRATILHVVDPQAEELRPLILPRLVGLGLVVWSGGGLAAAALSWLPRFADAAGLFLPQTPDVSAVRPVIWLGAAASGIGALAFLRPVRGTAPLNTIAAAVAVAAYLPLLWILALLLTRPEYARAGLYFDVSPIPQRIGLRLALAGTIVVILLGLRANARLLVRRSVALRSGRVDRQTILAMATALALVSCGDAVRLGAAIFADGWSPLLATIGTIVILVGSLFFTLGVYGAFVDCLRMRRAIATPSPSLRQLVHGS